MTVRKHLLLVVVLVAALLLAACGGSATPEAGTGEEAEGGGAVAAATSTTAPTATPVPSPTPEPTATEEVVEMGEQEFVSIDEVEDINSFRVNIIIGASGEAFEEGTSGFPGGEISITGEFVKEPLAQHFTMSLGGEGEEAMLGNIEVIRIDDTVYTNFAGQWIEGTSEDAPDFNDFLFIKPEDLSKLQELDQMGEEEINGRSTVHYQGDKEDLAALGDEGADMSDVEEAQLDVWIDQEAGFVVKMELVASGTGINDDAPEASGEISINMEYTDFNEEFTIEAPEVETTDISELLGLADFQLPEGASVDLSAPGFVQATFPMTLDETQGFLEESLAASGFELDADLSLPDAGTYVFTSGDLTLTVILTEDGDSTSVTITSE